MKQEMKRLIAMMFSVMLVISMMPAPVFAEDEISETIQEHSTLVERTMVKRKS